VYVRDFDDAQLDGVPLDTTSNALDAFMVNDDTPNIETLGMSPIDDLKTCAVIELEIPRKFSSDNEIEYVVFDGRA